MGQVIAGLGVFGVVIAVGWLLVRFGAVPSGSDTVLTRVCFYAATPALLVMTIGDADLGTVLSRETVASLAAETLGVLTAWAVHRWVLHRGVAESTIGALAGGYVNAANLGIPVLVVLLGSATAIAPILLLQLLVLSPVAFAILDWASQEGSASRLAAWTAPLRNPLLLGVLVGLVVNLVGWDLRSWLGGMVVNSLDTLGSLAVTVMMLSLGMSLAASSPRVTRRLTITQTPRLPAPPGRGPFRSRQPESGVQPVAEASAVEPAEAPAALATSSLPRSPAEAGNEEATTPPRSSATVEERRERDGRVLVLWISVLWKLAVVPLIALGLGAVLGLRGAALLVPVTTAALPCAQNVFMYATRYDVAKPLARDCVLLTTLGFVPVELLAAALLT